MVKVKGWKNPVPMMRKGTRFYRLSSLGRSHGESKTGVEILLDEETGDKYVYKVILKHLRPEHQEGVMQRMENFKMLSHKYEWIPNMLTFFFDCDNVHYLHGQDGEEAVRVSVGEREKGKPRQLKLHIISEYVDGEDLLDYINREDFDLQVRLNIAYNLFYMIAKLHQEKLVHSDIKMENIMVEAPLGEGTDYEMYMIDFESSCISTSQKTTCTQYVTTMGYAAPETLVCGFEECQYDFKSDVWSVSALVLYLFTGEGHWVPEEFREFDGGDDSDYVYISNLWTSNLNEESLMNLIEDTADKDHLGLFSWLLDGLRENPQHRSTASDMLSNLVLIMHQADNNFSANNKIYTKIYKKYLHQ